MSGLPWTGCSAWERTRHYLIQSYFRDISDQQLSKTHPNEPENSSSSEMKEENEVKQEPSDNIAAVIDQQLSKTHPNEPENSSSSEMKEENEVKQEPSDNIAAVIDQQLSKTHPNEPENSSSSEMKEENEVKQEPSDNKAAVIESVSPQQRKRKADMQVQCDLEYKLGKFLLGDSVIYNVCKCKDHKCK